ncbi:hypothetical protein [Thioclava kandeliae]|uniref:Terminase small subunit n=1 Tax=Thioclava kandeliae TaxID=3070818 RepID=A0ABV1SGG4_9RHOB
MTDKKKLIDWDGIRRDWEKEDWSIRRLADWYSVSESSIRKKAKQDDWPEREAVNAKKVRTEMEVRTETLAEMETLDPDDIVGRGKNLIFRLLGELDATTTHGTQLAEMIEAEENDPRRRAAMLKAIDLPNRANVVKALATAFKTWGESAAPEGKKAQRQKNAESVMQTGRFAPRSRPSNRMN